MISFLEFIIYSLERKEKIRTDILHSGSIFFLFFSCFTIISLHTWLDRIEEQQRPMANTDPTDSVESCPGAEFCAATTFSLLNLIAL